MSTLNPYLASGRMVNAGSSVIDQLDFFEATDPIVRKPGISYSSISVSVFANNIQVNWPIVDGTNIPDYSVSSGFVYFNEIIGSPGYYSMRWYPNSTGFWRLSFTYPTNQVTIIKEYDIVPSGTIGTPTNGIVTSFIK